jgi:CubicO group peptidase (beta-lactamase class C family)
MDGAATTPDGLSPKRLERLHEVLASHVSDAGVPGLAALIARRGNVHVETIGTMEAGAAPGTREVQRDSIFRIASMTKPVTAVASMMLVEECTIRLDESVDRLLPELADRRVLKDRCGPLDDTVPADRPITVRDLLTFRSGYGMVFAPPGSCPFSDAIFAPPLGQGPPRPSTILAPDDWMRELGTLPLVHQPGEEWLYNTGTDILGVLIARASGRPLDTFLQERIFEPLGMRDTGFTVPTDRRDRFTHCYSTNPETGATELFDAPDGHWSSRPAFPSGSGGLVSTVDDYLAFAQMLMHGGRSGHRRILSRPSVETMTTDQLTPAQKQAGSLVPGYWTDNGWGFGVSIVTRRTNLPSVGAYTWNGGLGSAWYNDPREELVLVLLTNRAWESPAGPQIVSDFVTAAYQAIDD